MLDADLAALYGTNTRSLVQAVKRNLHRFPEDFLFRLTEEEFARLRSQSVISNKTGRGGRRTLPYAFTEHGTVMLASVLNTPTAIQTSVAVVRAFVRLRMILASHAELVRRLNTLEKKNDAQFKAVFDAIRQLMIPVTNKKRPIGFRKD